jgi:predicted alpha/beta hydrolase
MPKSLPARCAPDSILEFRAAARERFHDANTLAAAGRRTAAIYLWGYTAEMMLKAAYFSSIGFSSVQAITPVDLRAAVAAAPGLGFIWVGNFHNLDSWTNLLINTRAALRIAYLDRRFGSQLVGHVSRLQRLWRETLRYHRNNAYEYETAQVRAAAAWLLVHSLQL